jgi:hypothetical protein
VLTWRLEILVRVKTNIKGSIDVKGNNYKKSDWGIYKLSLIISFKKSMRAVFSKIDVTCEIFSARHGLKGLKIHSMPGVV